MCQLFFIKMLNIIHLCVIILIKKGWWQNMTTQESMGIKIRSLREEKNLSQTELAALVGYKDKTAIAKVEAGKVDLPQSKILAFAKALNTTTSYLFSDNVESSEPQTLAAHFEGSDFTEDELDEIKQFANFVKAKRKQS